MSDNFCSNCGTSIIGQGGCKNKGCKGKVGGYNDSAGSDRPTLDGLKAELASMLQGWSGSHPEAMLGDISYAVDWWVMVQKPHEQFESPYKPKTSWIWPFADRLKYNLNKFLNLDAEFQGLIVSAWEDGIFWNGDDLAFFKNIIDEALTLKELGPEEYMAKALEKYSQAKSGFKISRSMHPCTKTASGKHEWIDRTGKNAAAPMQCVLCNRLLTDLQIKPMARRG